MPVINVTTITDFIITGFPGLQPRYYGLVSLLFLLVYLSIIAGNSLILMIVATERRLQKPQYLIFCKVAMTDIAIATTILPKVIARYVAEDKSISFSACFLQMFVMHSLQGLNSLLLMVMALDRHVAICNPLRYQALIKNSTISTLCGLCGLVAVTRMIPVLIQSTALPYCDSNVVVQCFCDHIGITKLACENVKEIQTSAMVGTMILLLGPLTFIIFSYVSIIVSVMKITSVEGRYKMFSTCSPQLFIICLYYIPRCFNQLANNLNFKFSADVRIAIIMLYCFLPPIVNPFIYCFRSKEVRETLVRKLKMKITSHADSFS